MKYLALLIIIATNYSFAQITIDMPRLEPVKIIITSCKFVFQENFGYECRNNNSRNMLLSLNSDNNTITYVSPINESTHAFKVSSVEYLAAQTAIKTAGKCGDVLVEIDRSSFDNEKKLKMKIKTKCAVVSE